MVSLNHLPKFECLQALAALVPEVDPTAVEACMVTLLTSRAAMQAFDAHFARHGLSEGRFTVLMLLLMHPEHNQSPSELADRAGVTRATMTGLLDGLERDGLVAREPHPADRRTIVARLTSKGEEFLRAMLPDHFRRVAALMAALTEEEQRQLVNLMVKVQAGIPAVSEP
jgi:DNA-binding MarR family transcriptional regulator